MLTLQQEKLCAFFAKTLKYKEDMDFGEHVSATSQEVKEFISNDGPGPSLDDLHLDCHRGKTSLWNKSAMEMMTAEFAEELEADEDMDWSEIPLDIIEGLVGDRFTRLMGVWRRAQPRIDEDGVIENSKEQEERIVANREAELKVNRHWSRRKAVSTCY